MMENKSAAVSKLQIAHEYPPVGEEQYISGMVADLQVHLEKLYPPGKALRQAHPKMHGCVKAEFSVLDNLGDDLRVGVFREPKTYGAYIRFSNAHSKIQHDIKKDVRGMAIKLHDVQGEKLLGAGYDSQDFVLISHDVFISKNVKEFHGLIQALSKSTFSLISFLLNPQNFSILKRLIQSNKTHYDVLNIPYFSTTPYLFGDRRAVKYHVAPANTAGVTAQLDKADNDFLKTNMKKGLTDRDYFFDFFIQFQTDPYEMPIEDPTVRWSSPYIKVARIRIPKQQFDTDEMNDIGESASFSPWHSLPEHRPLGGLNRARKQVYLALASFWRSRNEKYASKS